MTEQEARAIIYNIRRKDFFTFISVYGYQDGQQTPYTIEEANGENKYLRGRLIQKWVCFLIRYRVRTPTPDDGFNWLTGRMEDEG